MDPQVAGELLVDTAGAHHYRRRLKGSDRQSPDCLQCLAPLDAALLRKSSGEIETMCVDVSCSIWLGLATLRERSATAVTSNALLSCVQENNLKV